jgi:penicillin-binding protein 1A
MLIRILKWGSLLVLAAVVVVAALLLHDLPEPKTPVNGSTITVLDRDGQELAVYGAGGGRAVPVERLPQHLIDAVISIEDRRFRFHFGVDPLGIARALVTNLSSGRVVQGGSTLTQQLAKNLYLGPERTLKRKAQEAVLAVILESRFTKNEILELYLNRVYFGAGTYGVEAAAARYFAKPAADLSLRESAMLAGLLKAPSTYDPTRNPKGAAERMKLVVQAMVEAGHLDERKATRALNSPALPVARPRDEGVRYATDLVRERVTALIGNANGDLTVHTTIERRLQEFAASALGRGLAGKRAQGAAVVLTTMGQIRAIVGGANYSDSQYNRAVRSRRQPGSAFKPFFYLAALEAGWSPQDLILDAPISVGDWTPGNYRGRYLGEVSLTEAMARSANAAAVRLSETVGRTNGIDAARRLGINADLPDHPSVVLGTAEVTPLELAAAYAPFGNGGNGVSPHLILRIEDRSGDVLYRREGGGPGRVVDPGIAGDMAQMLRAVISQGSGKAANLKREAGGKTGTTQDSRDAWFAGITADFTAVVWTGHDDNTPMKGASGSGLPARIWRDIMQSAHHGLGPHPLPEGRKPESRVARSSGSQGGRVSGLWDRITRFLDGDIKATKSGSHRKNEEPDYQIEAPR